MMYGSADLLGVPWETIVKVYRQQLERRSFNTVDEYCKDFISWLGTDNRLFRDKDQRYHLVAEVVKYFLSEIKEPIDGDVKKWTSRHGKIGKRQINRIATAQIDKQAELVGKCKFLPYLTADFEDRLTNEYKDEIAAASEIVFGAYRLSEISKERLALIAVRYIAREVKSESGGSGIVIAGFGDHEKFPVVRAFKTHTIVCGRLIYDMDTGNSVNLNDDEPGESSAAICPFAQRDVVDSFLQGIEFNILMIVFAYTRHLLTQWPREVAKSLPKMKRADKNGLTKKLVEAGDRIFEKFNDDLRRYVSVNHINPMLDTVGVLPKEDLAAMADSLVSLTSVKRKMSLDVETVGGPVDVAVITKGDGFVWINRKHYFQPSLNPHFVRNYFERTQ